MIYLLTLLFASFAFAQGPSGIKIQDTEAPPSEFFDKYFYTSGNDLYACSAAKTQASETLTVASYTAGATTTLTFSADHGFHSSSNPRIKFTGGSGLWVGINDVFYATYVSATVVTIPLNSSAFGAVSGTIIATSDTPRLTSSVWAVFRFRNDGSGNPVSSLWAKGNWSEKCSNRASLYY